MQHQVNLYGTSKYVVTEMMNNNHANGIENKNCKIINKEKQILLVFSTNTEYRNWWEKTYGASDVGLEEGIYVLIDFY